MKLPRLDFELGFYCMANIFLIVFLLRALHTILEIRAVLIP